MATASISRTWRAVLSVTMVTLCFVLTANTARAAEQIDQSNLPEWDGGWTHVNPDGEDRALMWQTFTPSFPNLTAVEIDIRTISPGQGDDVLTVEIAKDGEILASADSSVADGFDGLLRFEFPDAVSLVPEQVYELKVRDTGRPRFGWKFGSNTYERGSRYVSARERHGSDWFFRTYSNVEPAQAKYSGGTGDPNDPYQIATAEDLMLLGETPDDYDKHFILTADIDLDPNLPGRWVFDRAVIAPDTNDVEDSYHYQGRAFSGYFDGHGRKINKLHIEGSSDLGLFGQLGPGGLISNLALEAVNVNGTHYIVGSLVGYNDEGSITSCHSTGTVSGSEDVGGLVGGNSGTITACYSTGSVNGGWRMGGLVATNAGTITSCYSTCTVISGSDSIGGLAGDNYGSIASSYSTGSIIGDDEVGGLVGENGGYIRSSYSNGSVNGEHDVGGLAGANFHTITTSYSTGVVTGTGGNVGGLVGGGQPDRVSRSFWDMETSGQGISNGGTGLTTAEMQTATAFLDAGWDFEGETANGPNDIWKISEGLHYPRLWWEKYGGGTGEPNDPYRIYTADHLNTLGAEPNDYDKHFKLMADIDLSGYSYDRAVIAPDVDPREPSFDGTSFRGVFDGNSHAISNLEVTGESYLGLFGRLEYGAEIKNLGLLDVNITGSDYLGGLIGFSKGDVATSYCTGTIAGDERIGGLTGRNWSTIAASYSTATVTGNDNVGGIAGDNYGSITACYSTGTVNGGRHVGGLAGQTTGSITGCYSTGMVSGEQYVGGLVAGRHPDYGVVADCFWDVQTSGLAGSEGGTGLTTAEMQTASTFLEAGWDFVDEVANGTEDIWWILEGQDYPRLWWEVIAEN